MNNDGVVPLLYSFKEYTTNKLQNTKNRYYWNFCDQYELQLDDSSVIFNAHSYETVKQNIWRFESEESEIRELVNELNEDDVFYDIGANTGLYTLFAADKCRNGQIIAFEPVDININQLEKNMTLNKFTNIKPYEVALSDSSDTVKLDYPEDSFPGYGLASMHGTVGETTVHSYKGDEFIEKKSLPIPNVLKIDVEGAEGLVIKGLEETLVKPKCRTIFCEVHQSTEMDRPSASDYGMAPTELRKLIESFGFEVEKTNERKTTFVFKCSK